MQVKSIGRIDTIENYPDKKDCKWGLEVFSKERILFISGKLNEKIRSNFLSEGIDKAAVTLRVLQRGGMTWRNILV